jgi:hypothetical protein
MVQRIISSIRHTRIRAFDWLPAREIQLHQNASGKPYGTKKQKTIKKGMLPAGDPYFLGLSASYSASTGAMVFVDMDRRTSVVSLRQ